MTIILRAVSGQHDCSPQEIVDTCICWVGWGKWLLLTVGVPGMSYARLEGAFCTATTKEQRGGSITVNIIYIPGSAQARAS